MKRYAALGLLLSGVVLASPLQSRAELASPPPRVSPGDLAPEAAGVVLQGDPGIRLSALRGRVVVLDFWASWCGPCIESIPKLNNLWLKVQAAGLGDRFEILAVGLDRQVDAARQFINRHRMHYPVVVDSIGIASRNFGVWRLPATYVIDATGHVNQIYFGDGPEFGQDIEARVFALLALPGARETAQASEDTGNP